MHCIAAHWKISRIFWSSNNPGNIMKYRDRYRYATLNSGLNLSTSNLQRTWVKAINTRGCNPFLHKMALYLTNYHAAISVHKTRAGLIRDYYDRILQALTEGADFIEIMRIAASSAAVSRAYGHQYNHFRRNGVFYGNDDFAREFFQLFFRILGTTEDPEYHEDTTIEHNAWLLTGMNLDKALNAYGSSSSGDWYVGPLDFSDHTDDTGRNILNRSSHYDSDLGSGSCLEILHAIICGATADEKIAGLVSVAAAHPESLDNVPVTIVDFFADDNLDQGEIAGIRAAWEDANYDILHFVRAYAISTAFHSNTTFKYKTAFDRNLSIQNANVLTNEETFAREYYDSPYARMATQGAEVFEPAHDVFGGQTGLQAAHNRYIFKNAYWQNVAGSNFLADTSDAYTLDGVTELRWEKDWGAVIPLNGDGEHVVGEIAGWLWNRFIADGGQNFDPVARAQVQALLAHGRDFGYSVDPDNPEAVFSSADITSGSAAATDQANAAVLMDFSTTTANDRVGMAVNFITMTPYAFAMGGQ